MKPSGAIFFLLLILEILAGLAILVVNDLNKPTVITFDGEIVCSGSWLSCVDDIYRIEHPEDEPDVIRLNYSSEGELLVEEPYLTILPEGIDGIPFDDPVELLGLEEGEIVIYCGSNTWGTSVSGYIQDWNDGDHSILAYDLFNFCNNGGYYHYR